MEKDKQTQQVSKYYKTILTVEDCIEATAIVSRKKERNEIVKNVMYELKLTLISLMVAYSDNQLAMWAADLCEHHKHETEEDLILILRNARRGVYGKGFKTFDLGMFQEWLTKHLDKKAEERENQIGYTGGRIPDEPKHAWEDYDEYVESVAEGYEIQKQLERERKRRKLEAFRRDYSEYQRQLKPFKIERDGYEFEVQARTRQDAEKRLDAYLEKIRR